MLNLNFQKAISALLVFFLFALTLGSARASGLSKRRASMRSSRSSSRKLRTNRNAVSQRGYRQTKNSVSSSGSSDSSLKRAFRSVVKVNARGGGLANTVGQMMTRDNSVQSKRTGNNWRRGVGYTVNAGNAVRYLANSLNRR